MDERFKVFPFQGGEDSDIERGWKEGGEGTWDEINFCCLFNIADLLSLVISNCTFNDNCGEGVSINKITGNIDISTSDALRNKEGGLSAQSIFGKITVTDTRIINNTHHGLKIQNGSFLSLNCHGVSTKGNSESGFYLQRVALKGNISDSAFDGNKNNGFVIANGAGNIQLRNISAVLNRGSGVRLYDGKVSSTFSSCNFSMNRRDGCSMSNQAGAHYFFNCTANSNLRHGVTLIDVRTYYNDKSRHQFRLFHLVETAVSDNGENGVNLGPYCHYWSESAANVTITIINNMIVRNGRGGIVLSPYSRCYYWHSQGKPRKVSAIFSNNNFERNRGRSFYVYCTGRFGLEAVMESNRFINNTDKVLTMVDDNQCGANYKASRPVNVEIRENVFLKNQVSEKVVLIDFSSFPDARSATIINNTFEDNEAVTKNRFPKFYHRTTTRAVIVLKEGTFTIRENVFENPGFAFQISTLRHDHQRVVDAKLNWWGTADECKIIDRIFDFHHRVQLSPVDFFPYITSYNKTSVVNSNISRPLCFLRNESIGGILDRILVLSSGRSPYKVRDDIIVLTNGSLVIEKNVTLYFPPRSAMVVKGTLVVSGTENEKVRFMKKTHGKLRLAGRSGPWQGRVEFLVNDTWVPLCLSYYKSFTTEGEIICQQVGLNYQWYHRSRPPEIESVFVHNVVCDGDVDVDIMNCNAESWRYGHTCQGYTVYLYCENQNWAGIHLAMSNHQSSLHHLEINEAGFAYRNDINIPGAALKIDFNHHNISNIFVNNSDGIGLQVLYQSLFHNLSLMSNSTIANTRSHGIYSLSPSITLRDVDMRKNSGNGFVLRSTWDQTNTFATEMSSPGMNRTFHICSQNKTFLEGSRVFHLTLEALDNSQDLTCQHVLETEPGYKLVIQELYYSQQRYSYHLFLDVYDGLNMSDGSPWKMASFSWRDRPVFNSTYSTILFYFRKRAHWNIKTYFMVYTVKG